MDAVLRTAEEAFCLATEELMADRMQYGCLYKFKLAPRDTEFESLYAEIWSPKTAWKDNKELTWPRFLIEAVFPERLWKEHGTLTKMLEDIRLYDYPHATKKGTNHSHFGRMCRPRKVFDGTIYLGYLDYMLDRWKREHHKSYPHFYFDCESPEWMFEELFKNPNQIKSGRTATSCTANFSFRYNSKTDTAHVIQILKHSQWSHIYGDFCGTAALARALLAEPGINIKNCVCTIMAVSMTMDAPKIARRML